MHSQQKSGHAPILGAFQFDVSRNSRSLVRVQKLILLAGTPDEIAKKIQSFVDVGVHHIIMNIQPKYDPALLRRFATEVMPRFRAGT